MGTLKVPAPEGAKRSRLNRVETIGLDLLNQHICAVNNSYLLQINKQSLLTILIAETPILSLALTNPSPCLDNRVITRGFEFAVKLTRYTFEEFMGVKAY